MMTQKDLGGANRDAAEAIAIQALAFIAADETLLPRFLALTGIEASQIRAVARQPGFLAGVLQFILAHEPTLLSFAAEAGIDAGVIGRMARALPNGDENYERST